MDMNMSKLWVMVKNREDCDAAFYGVARVDTTWRLTHNKTVIARFLIFLNTLSRNYEKLSPWTAAKKTTEWKRENRRVNYRKTETQYKVFCHARSFLIQKYGQNNSENISRKFLI